MALPTSWKEKLAFPAVAAPMFLVSGPDLVVETCRSGVVGTFPALNQRTSEGYEAWLVDIRRRLDASGIARSVRRQPDRSQNQSPPGTGPRDHGQAPAFPSSSLLSAP